MSTISKTEFTFAVLHRTDEPFDGDDPLADALERSDSGNAVGSIVNETTQTVDDGDVKHQLELLGNDGTFFEDDLDDGEGYVYEATHLSRSDGSDAMLVSAKPFVLVNEEGTAWQDDRKAWKPITRTTTTPRLKD